MIKHLLVIPFLLLGTLLAAQCISGDCRNGVGTYKYPSGARYTGHFQDGEIHGIGVCYYTDGSKYQGEWVNRYPDGRGTKTYSDGTTRTGMWKKGRPVDTEGNVLEEYIARKQEESTDDGTNIQSGCLAGDCKNGPGTYAYPDGSKYDGNFSNGKFQGDGVFTFANGDVYQGSFKNNYPDGHGTRKLVSGEEETGEWKQGEFLGTSLMVNGKVGCIEGNCDDGQGTYVYKEGSAKYTGSFKNGAPHGFGTCQYANGDVYEGEWEDGAFGGKGSLRLRDNTTVAGFWRSGEFLGQSQPEDYVAKPATVVEEEKPVQLTTKAKVWAVVTGVASYDHMPVLRYTDDDAYRFYAFLKSLEGGALPDEQVRILIDEEATRENVLGTLNEVFSMAGPEDLVIFYFSGHGLNGSFLPIDFDGFNNKIGHDEIAAIFGKCKAKFKLCLADACHSGSLIAMRSGETEPLLVQYYKTLSKSVSGTALIMSSKAEETSLESSGLRQGVFSHFLIRGLKGEADANQDKIVTIEELYDYINKNVRSYTGNRQSPVIKGTYDPKMTVAVVRR
ncbi:MAG: caspase family protein [Saprospiraceae bacterium]|nr:caspase family protein [Saprospiraceae bacterium]MCB9343833.1 caspase family protein [Lewinellaceae bacterium]